MRLAWIGAVAVVAVSAAPAWQFRNWQWIALAVTVAVVLPALTPDRHHSPVIAADGATPYGPDRSPPVVRAWFASTRAVDGVGWARDRGSPPAEVAGTMAAAVAALAWSVTALLGGAGTPGFVQAAGAPALALDTAAVLGALLLLPRDPRPGPADRTAGPPFPPHTARPAEPARTATRRLAFPDTRSAGGDRTATRLGALVVATAVAALGFRLGAGDGAGAVAAAAAVLVAGCPCALLLLPVPAPAPPRLRLRAEHGEGVLRAAAALHAWPPLSPSDERHSRTQGVDESAVRATDPWPADLVGQALVDAARRRYPALPGASDVDGDPATGLRGVVSELSGDVVLAHAVLAGPPEWLIAHGVTPPAEAGRSWCVAWDGEARGRLELVAVPRPGAGRRRVGTVVAVAAAGLGAGAAAAGALSPATAGVVPVAAVLLVVALRMFRVPDRAGRGRPIGATSG